MTLARAPIAGLVLCSGEVLEWGSVRCGGTYGVKEQFLKEFWESRILNLLKISVASEISCQLLKRFEVTVTDDNIKKRFAIKTSRSRLQWRFHHTHPPLARLYSTIGKQYFNLLIVYRRALRNYHHLLCFRIRLGGGNGRKARREEASEKKSGRDSLISLLQRSNKTRVFIHFSVSLPDFYDVF